MKRKPFQGVWNIIRFNWPFYLLSLGLVFLLLVGRNYFFGSASTIAFDILLLLIICSALFSLVASFFVYDLSGFYEFRWLDETPHRDGERIANINAGFDETSSLLKGRFENAELFVCDFFDPVAHTEASIMRARNAYPPFPGTQNVSTNKLPFQTGSIEKVFAIMSAHEIRNADERQVFFSEVRRVLAVDGQVIVVEHLRDAANLLVYNVGALHFYSRATWLETFNASKFYVVNEKRITPFLTVFFLSTNGIEP